MLVGVDLDNTVVCYDEVLRKMAPPGVPATRSAIRAALAPDAWTALQGEVYGPGMAQALPYPGVQDFFAACARAGVETCIVSHRTRRPAIGPPYDLHAAARAWTLRHDILDPSHVFLEETRAAKLARIAALGCTHFIDDLPGVLCDQAFPAGVARACIATDLADGRYQTLRGWEDAAAWIGATDLVAQAGWGNDIRLASIPGGANNRIYRLDSGKRRGAIKAYFLDPSDKRDRLGTEFAFASYAWNSGIGNIPRPLAKSPGLGLGLYAYVDGRPVAPGEVTEADVAEAVDFFAALSRGRHAPEATALPAASEACFSLAAHIALVRARVEALTRIDGEAGEFAAEALAPALCHAKETAASETGTRFDEVLAPEERRPSPSDFGFHNALRAASGRLSFLDFEYAGWDDPAKTVCDFAIQPQVPVPPEGQTAFAEAVAADASDQAWHRTRVALLMPVYRIKWCCILLNEFVAVGQRRRAFAMGPAQAETRKAGQLAKARHLFEAHER